MPQPARVEVEGCCQTGLREWGKGGERPLLRLVKPLLGVLISTRINTSNLARHS